MARRKRDAHADRQRPPAQHHHRRDAAPPPVIQAVVAEIYGPDADTRRQVAADLTGVRKASMTLADVDNYMSQPYEAWRS